MVPPRSLNRFHIRTKISMNVEPMKLVFEKSRRICGGSTVAAWVSRTPPVSSKVSVSKES